MISKRGVMIYFIAGVIFILISRGENYPLVGAGVVFLIFAFLAIPINLYFRRRKEKLERQVRSLVTDKPPRTEMGDIQEELNRERNTDTGNPE